MTDNRRKRNLQKEMRYHIYWDFSILIILSLLISSCSSPIHNVGSRNIVFMGAVFAVVTGALMIAFEKYRPGITDLWERNVINVLSVLISFAVLVVINMVFFMSRELFVLQLLVAVSCLMLLIVGNAIINGYFSNTKVFRKSRILIIDTEDKNFSRMKRIKYGIDKIYDSWYECLNKQEYEDIEKYADETFPLFDSVCVLDGLSDEDYNIVVKKAMELNKEIFVVPKIIDIGKCRAPLVRFDDILTLYIPEHSLNAVEAAVKRMFDIALSGLGLIVAAIPMLLIAAAIKLTSPGPVFYKQLRLTKDKKEFYIYKFRTMVADAEKLSGPTFAQKDDPRITKVGKILRACRLDELPQLLNIFKGDMSVVGPRPERPFFVQQFESEVENYDYRFRVKAGLTALSHVYGRYSTYIHDRTCYDLYYIANYSMLLDIKIILLTAKTMFLKSAAEGEDEFKIKNKEVAVNEKNKDKNFVKVKKMFYRNKITGFRKMVSLMLIGGLVASCLYGFNYVYTQYAVANVNISLLYPEIADSNYPDKSRFTYYDLISIDKIEKALDIMHEKGLYQHYTADEIEDNLYIHAHLSDSAKDAVSYQRSEGNDYSYVANEYQITFVQPHDYHNPNIVQKIFSPDYGQVFLEALVEVNKKEITEKYGGFNGFRTLADKQDTSKYDYSEWIDIYRTKINSAVNYLNELENASPGFVSATANMGVKDVAAEYKLLLTTKLDAISSYIDTSAISKDIQIASNKINVNIENNQLKFVQYNDEVAINKNAQQKYDHTFTENLIVVTINENSGLYQARPKTAFDEVVTRGLDANNNVQEYGKELRALNSELTGLAYAQGNTAEYTRLCEKCEQMITDFEAEYEKVTEVAKTVVQEYNESTNKAFVKSVNAGKNLISTEFLINLGVMFALGAAIIFVWYVAAGMLRDRRKMKKKAKKLRDIREGERS